MPLLKLLSGQWSIDFPPGEAPPTEFLIFEWGVNTSTQGEIILDRKLVSKMLRKLEHHGVDQVADWNHASVRENPTHDDCKASAWYDLEMRDDGLWAVNVRWTPQALEDFKGKSYRYFSPAFWTDKQGRMVDWINLAILNQPATDNQRPLIAASEDRMKTRQRRTLGHKNLAEHLKAHMECHEMSSEEFAKHCGIPHEHMKSYLDGEKFPGKEHAGKIAAATGMKQSHIDGYSEKFGEDLEDDENGGQSHEEDEDGHDDDAGDDEEEPVRKKTGQQLDGGASELMLMTGTKTPQQARKAFLEMQAAAGQTAKLLQRFERLEKANAEREVRELVSKALGEGKIAPSQKEWAMKLGGNDIESLRELVELSTPRFRGAEPPIDPDSREQPFGLGGPGGDATLGESIDNVVAIMSQTGGHPALGDKVKVTKEAVRERAKKGHSVKSA